MSRITGSPAAHGHRDRPGRRHLAALLALLVIVAPPASALEDYEAGKQAYLAGDYSEAFRIWQPLARDGDKFAQFSLGDLYFEGNGVEQDQAASARYFALSADQGYAPAQFNLGNAYLNGHGVEPDDAKAAEWWRKAAEQDFAPAQFNLATQYYLGRGVLKDEETAIRWFRRAAQNGHPKARQLFDMTGQPTERAEGDAPPGPTPTAPAAATPVRSTPPGAPSGPSARTPETVGPNESWILAQNPDDYTLQLLATSNEEKLLAYLKKHRFREPVAYFAFQRDGTRWYAAAHGAYPGKAQARDAAAALPPGVAKNPPWIRRFGEIHELIETR
jgi:TPR repeat protein